MAMTFQEKVDLIGKYKDKNDKFASVYKYGKNIDSPKLNDEQKEKVRKNVEVAYNAIKQMQDKKPTKTATAKGGVKKKTMLGLASEIKKRDNVSWDEAKKRAKRDYESEKKKLEKEEKQQLADFKKQVGKIKFVRATTKTDINKDKVIPALPSGKRYPKRGKTTNQWGTFNNNPKKPYWENRANRMDVNQPSKSVYPKLADGGEVNVFDNIFADYGFTKKRGAYGIKVFFNKDKNIYAQYDMKARELSVDDKDLRFSIRDLIEHLKSLGLTGKKYAKGGKFNDNLYIDQLANMSGARAVAVKEWASANNLSKDDLLNIIQGLGRKQITPSEFVGAVLGNKNDTSKIVSYAKEGKGFKMAKGGKVDKKKYKFEITEYKDENAVINDKPTLSDYEGTKEKVIDFQYQRMQRGYCVYFNITIVADSNNQGWFYESEDLYDLIDKIENSYDDDDDESNVYKDRYDIMSAYGYAKGGNIDKEIKYPIAYIDVLQSKPSLFTKVRKTLEKYGIEIDNSKNFHTKGYAEELYGENYNGEEIYTIVCDIRDASNPIELEKEIDNLGNKNSGISVVYHENDEYAKGGLIEHGLKTGDRIVSGKIIGTTIRVHNESLDEDAKVDLNTGKRTLITYDKKSKKWVEKMAQGGEVKSKRENYNHLVMMLKKNESALERSQGTEMVEKTQQEIQRIKDILRNEYGEKFAQGGTTKRIKRMGC